MNSSFTNSSCLHVHGSYLPYFLYGRGPPHNFFISILSQSPVPFFLQIALKDVNRRIIQNKILQAVVHLQQFINTDASLETGIKTFFAPLALK